MATYSQLFDLRSDSGLKNRIAVACVVQAEVIRAELPSVTNHANRMIWAKQTFSDPLTKAEEMFWALLAANQSLTTAQIQGASDSAILSAVAAAVDTFATGA